jgi:hypothetical protein
MREVARGRPGVGQRRARGGPPVGQRISSRSWNQPQPRGDGTRTLPPRILVLIFITRSCFAVDETCDVARRAHRRFAGANLRRQLSCRLNIWESRRDDSTTWRFVKAAIRIHASDGQTISWHSSRATTKSRQMFFATDEFRLFCAARHASQQAARQLLEEVYPSRNKDPYPRVSTGVRSWMARPANR